MSEFEPGVYVDGARGHKASVMVIEMAAANGMTIDPFESWAIDTWDEHGHLPTFPNDAMDSLLDNCVDHLNTVLKIPFHTWRWDDGDFGLYPDEDVRKEDVEHEVTVALSDFVLDEDHAMDIFKMAGLKVEQGDMGWKLAGHTFAFGVDIKVMFLDDEIEGSLGHRESRA